MIRDIGDAIKPHQFLFSDAVLLYFVINRDGNKKKLFSNICRELNKQKYTMPGLIMILP
jgi:hypothetical protein